ncbi:MAG: thioredoxin family protein [Chitinophagaceae bacterium]|nr:thioredoxin family protein [Chitinophagaceae bacterium]
MKNTMMFLILLFTFLVTSFSPDSQRPGYKPGDVAGDFSLKNINGKMVSLNDFKDSKGVIVIFTCNHCPYSVAYEDRIIALHKNYAGKGFPVVAINPNDPISYPDDSYENMKIRAKEKGFKFPYLIDETQEIAKAYGAMKTPHVFILKREGSGFVVAYIGAIDDNSNEPELVQEKYAEQALNEILSGKPVSQPLTKAIGCGVKWRK